MDQFPWRGYEVIWRRCGSRSWFGPECVSRCPIEWAFKGNPIVIGNPINNPGCGRILLTILVLASLFCAASAGEDKKPASDAPAESNTWSIHWEGYAGTPHDRSWFEVNLSHNGVMTVKRKRVRQDWRTVFEGKLMDDEVKRFHDTTTRIIKEYQADKSEGRSMDGWNFMLELKPMMGEAPSGRASFTGQMPLYNANSRIKELRKVISGHLKKGEVFPE